jgi:hypothetical protein
VVGDLSLVVRAVPQPLDGVVHACRSVGSERA